MPVPSEFRGELLVLGDLSAIDDGIRAYPRPMGGRRTASRWMEEEIKRSAFSCCSRGSSESKFGGYTARVKFVTFVVCFANRLVPAVLGTRHKGFPAVVQGIYVVDRTRNHPPSKKRDLRKRRKQPIMMLC